MPPKGILLSGLRLEIEQLRHSLEPESAHPDPALWHEDTREEWLLRAPRAFDGQRHFMVEALRHRLSALAHGLPPAAIARALDAMSRVPRERFVCPWIADLAYLPMAIDIGLDQTISHPEMVAILVAAADPDGGHVLDVGTGSGYQAAVLSLISEHVTSIEIIAPHAERARQRIRERGYENASVVHGDAGELTAAFPRHQFDAIVIAARSDRPPANLVSLLKTGGRLVMPIEDAASGQNLVLFRKTTHDRLDERIICPAQFVPLTGVSRNAVTTGM